MMHKLKALGIFQKVVSALKAINAQYDATAPFGSAQSQCVDKTCAVLLAFTPILQHYKGLFVDAGFTVLILVGPWVFFRLCQYVVRSKPTAWIGVFAPIFGLILFNLYKPLIHEFRVMNLMYGLVMICYFAAAACGKININLYIKTSACIAIAACILILFQYVFYYFFGFHLQLTPTSLFLEESSIWILCAQTGRVGVTGAVSSFYRPSAFFLEPSHMFLYLFPHIFLVLYSPKMSRCKFFLAVLFSVGLLLTTSGMGIMTVVGAWGVWLLFSDRADNELRFKHLLRKRNLIICGCFVVCCTAMILCVPFVRNAVSRVLDFGKGGAIAGRTRLSFSLVGEMNAIQLIFGVTSNLESIDFNMPGFVATLYKFGIVGVVLSYTLYVWGSLKLKQQYFWISIIVILTSFFSAHTHGTFYMIYYVFFLLAGGQECRLQQFDTSGDICGVATSSIMSAKENNS